MPPEVKRRFFEKWRNKRKTGEKQKIQTGNVKTCLFLRGAEMVVSGTETGTVMGRKGL